MSNLRNVQILSQVEAHPMKSTLAKILDLAEEFKDAVEAVSDNKDLTAEGKGKAMQGHLRRAIRDLRDAKAPIAEMQNKLTQKRKAVAMPAFDQNDIVGFLRRQELRAALRAAANTGQRTLLLEDPTFADACLEQPAALSGLHPQHGEGEAKDQGNQDFVLVEAVKKRRLETLFAPQLAEIAAMEETIGQANDIANVAHNDLKLHSGMDDRAFTEFVRPIELKTATHWLRKDADGTIRVIDLLAPGGPVGRIATADEQRDGKYYRDHAEYLADRAA
jgi:hypothetical protein